MRLVGVCGWAFLFLSSFVLSLVGGWRGLVGLLFEICIVDASIFTIAGFSCRGLSLDGGVCGGGCVIIFAPWTSFPYGFAVCEESAGSFLDCGVGRVFCGLCRA